MVALWAVRGLLVGLLLAVAFAPEDQGGTSSQSYMETFDGTPTSPGPYRPPGWDVQIDSRNPDTWLSLEPMAAHHGPACQGPPATHALTGDYPSAVFNCANHVMTSLQASGYGVIYLTPPALLDWSQGEAVVRWDMSTHRSSLRDWVDVWISPLADHLVLPLNETLPDLNGPPAHAIHAQMVSGGVDGGVWTSFGGSVYDQFAPTYLPNATYQGYETVLTTSMAQRTTFEVRLSATHLKIGLPGHNVWWIDTDIDPLTWTSGTVQFGHHSYTPFKDCQFVPNIPCLANSWHWDNVSLSPALPLSITALSPRQLSDQAPGGWTFPAPTAAGTVLAFAANSGPSVPLSPTVELSWDRGTTWGTYQPQNDPAGQGNQEHARSYWVPVPVGATSVQVRGHGGYWGAYWQAKDAHLWSAAVDQPPPLPTPTPPPPGMTPTLLPLPTETPGPTVLPVPTNTPGPATPAPSPPSACVVQVQRQGLIIATWTCQ